MRRGRLLLLVLASVCLAACDKVPLVDIGARFALADAAWFEEEETLFVFYRVDAQQGLGPDSQVEVRWRTDDGELPWTPISALTPVHLHVPVDCGKTAVCGSTSLPVTGLPREVGVRLRYHRDGALTLDSRTLLNLVGRGPPHSNRSLVVYGVFDEANERVQWRARHQFPTLRNEDAQALGLRRWFKVDESWYGDLGPPRQDNPYGYGYAPGCDPGLSPTGASPTETTERAVFDPRPLPRAAAASPVVCARVSVTDARGTFDAPAIARKNPEVKPPFPSLRSPVRENTQLRFLLRPCKRTISEPHLEMQRQRLLLSGAEELCLDDFRDAGFSGDLASTLRARIDRARAEGKDMVLVLALHHDDTTGKVQDVLEQALQIVLPPELDKSTPRVSGAFVFDSTGYTIAHPANRRFALWCPANMLPEDLEDVEGPDSAAGASEHYCPLMPDMPDLDLGPLRFASLPILPTRKQYLSFIDRYSEAQAGQMKTLTFRAPERTPFSENVLVGEYAAVTFFNNEVVTATPTDVFSFCAPEDGAPLPIAFRTRLAPAPMPLEALPVFHQQQPEPSYALGIAWDFPFLLRLEYEVVIAGAATAFGLSVPFGIDSSAEAYYGAGAWQIDEFPLSERLLRCSRFCDHPTFDSAGVYNVTQGFESTYLNQCYRPRFPVPADGGFPRDP